MKTDIHLWQYLARFFLECFRQKLYRKSNHTFCVKTFLYENLAVYEIMWKNIVWPDRPQISIWRMRIACWIA